MISSLDVRGNVRINNCSFNSETSFSLCTLLPAGKTIFITKCGGKLIIYNLTTASTINIQDFHGEIVVDATCDDGTVNIIGGAGKITDNSAGTTVTVDGFFTDLSPKGYQPFIS
jgi:hypothetical protein